MTKITKEELLHIARISHLDIHENEIDGLMAQLESVLSYAECVQELASDVQESSNKALNVFREDVVVKINPEPILALSPEREADYFVVPKIIDNAE